MTTLAPLRKSLRSKPKKKRVMRSFKVHELSMVDVPAQEGAVMTLIKSKGEQTEIAQTAFQRAFGVPYFPATAKYMFKDSQRRDTFEQVFGEPYSEEAVKRWMNDDIPEDEEDEPEEEEDEPEEEPQFKRRFSMNPDAKAKYIKIWDETPRKSPLAKERNMTLKTKEEGGRLGTMLKSAMADATTEYKQDEVETRVVKKLNEIQKRDECTHTQAMQTLRSEEPELVQEWVNS